MSHAVGVVEYELESASLLRSENDDFDVRTGESGESRGTENGWKVSTKAQKGQHGSTRFPYSVAFIVGNEFCERFSFYGIRTILILYLTNYLGIIPSTATSLYHTFVVIAYFTPVLGAIIADGYLGKYKTILYISCIYALGNILMSVTAFPPPEIPGPLLSLFLIALGTGGIKPCVSSFGGDQFGPNQKAQVATFFSIFYFAINSGSLISTFLTPILKEDVHCLGQTSCFPLAYGVPAVLMIISLIIFVAGSKLYVYKPLGENVVGNFISTTIRALKNRCSKSSKYKVCDHWLDHAKGGHVSDSFISDMKVVYHVLFLFIPLPVFWTLFDQQGSRWTLQAERMDGQVGTWKFLPDQMQVVNPLLIIILIPLFEGVIYPLLAKCGLVGKPLQKMVIGMLLAAVAFVIAGLLELKIQASEETPLPSGHSDIRVINDVPCFLNYSSPVSSGQLEFLQVSEESEYNEGTRNLTFQFSSPCSSPVLPPYSFRVESRVGESYNVLVGRDPGGSLFAETLVREQVKSVKGEALVSFVSSLESANQTVLLEAAHQSYSTDPLPQFGHTPYLPLVPGIYSASVRDETSGNVTSYGNVEVENGGIYTVIVSNNNSSRSLVLFLDRAPNTVSMAWQLPQYAVLTCGEILFSVTGLAFSYSQAPENMKSVLSAAWLLTDSLGNVLVIIIAEVFQLPQTIEFFVFAGLMVVVTLIFAVMTCFYVYNDSPETSSSQEDDRQPIMHHSDEQLEEED